MTACNNLRSKNSYEPPIPGIEWGITEEELLERLQAESVSLNEEKEGTSVFQFQSSVFNCPAEVMIQTDHYTGLGAYLAEIHFTDYDEGNLRKALTDMYGEPSSQDRASVRLEWKSVLIRDLPEGVQSRIQYARIGWKYTGAGSKGMWEAIRRSRS